MSRRLGSTATRTAVTAVIGLSLVVFGIPPAYAGGNGHGGGHGGGQSHDDEPVTVATGLNNPRQLTIGQGNRLYVAEAGSAAACDPITGVGAEYEFCGLTGSVTEVRGDQQRRVVTGLPALGFNGEIMGASDVDMRGNRISVLVGGMAGAASARDLLPEEYAAFGTLQTGRLRWAPLDGDDLRLTADLLAHEVATNPDGNEPPDSNAVGLAALGSDRWAVTDAGGNSLMIVNRDGERTLAVFPNGAPAPDPFGGPGMIPPQAVPTDVVVGPDGAYYVSQLTGFPFPTGASTIWRVTRHGDVSAYATGLTMVTSLAWKGRTLYAVQLDDGNFFDGHVGSLREITRGGDVHEAVVDGLPAPYGVAIRGSSAYITLDSISSGGGSVVRVDLR